MMYLAYAVGDLQDMTRRREVYDEGRDIEKGGFAR